MRDVLLLIASALFFALPATAAPDVLAPADNLVVEGVPSPPMALVEGAERYTEFRAAQMSSWHPLRPEMLISTRFADTPQMHLVKSPGAARTQLTFFKDAVRQGSFQPTRGDYFVFEKDTGGGEFFQKYRYDLSNQQVTLLTDGKSRNTAGTWSTAGDRYAYVSTRRNGQDTDIYIMDPAKPGSDRELVQLQGGGWEPLDWAPDDKTLLVIEYISANQSYLWLVDTTTGAKEPATPRDTATKVAYSGAKFSHDGKGFYVATDRDSEFQKLAFVDLHSKKYTYLTDSINWDVEEFALSWDGKQIAVITDEDGLTGMRLYDATTMKELTRAGLPPGQVSGLRWHKNNRLLSFNLTSSSVPSDVYSLDISTNKIDRWTYSETGGMNTGDFSQPQLVHWKSFDGLEISGFEYKPASKFSGKRPVIVNIHGGPESQWRPFFLGRTNYLLNEMGVAVVYPNVRGSTGYGKTFALMDNGFKREDSYKDIGALLDWIKKQPDLDGDRIMVTGGSYGGFMTLATATWYSDKIRCALDVVGPSNLVTFLKNTQAYRRDLRRAEYGDERDAKMSQYLEKIAPANHATNIKKPLYVVQGKNDPRVPASESVQMVKAIRSTGTPVWFLMANDEGHGFSKKRNSDFQFYTTIEFINSFLLN
jgi:dipeptidyl aminopeptidase/acylaminoacyl peptidase